MGEPSQQRLRDLLGAVVSVTTDLTLTRVLERIVESAAALVDARYAALGVLAPDGTHLVEFITFGMSAEERAAIGPLPRGRGVLGTLIREPHVFRLEDIATHRDYSGFPPNHPPMHTFLGAPIRIRDAVYGNLYLSEKVGRASFTAEDEATLVALAAAAGVAIDNARQFAAGQQRQRWSLALAEMTHLLLEREDEQGALRLLTDHCLGVGGAARAVVATTVGGEDADLVVRAVSGSAAGPDRETDPVVGATLDGPAWSLLRRQREPQIFPAGDVEATGQRAAVRDVLGAVSPASVLAVVPLLAGQVSMGVLALAFDSDVDREVGERVRQIASFARQSTLALVAARGHRDRASMALLQDRERIARDMHDHVIQRLFATGLSLESARRLVDHPTAQARIEEAVDGLDVAIREIRQAIFELHRPTVDSPRAELEALIGSFTGALGRPAEVAIAGDLDGLTPIQRADLTAVVGEGLANAARHARAATVWVHVAADDDLRIVVEDDGTGIDPDAAQSGLVNLAARASAGDGSFTITPRDPSGTTLTWQVPLRR